MGKGEEGGEKGEKVKGGKREDELGTRLVPFQTGKGDVCPDHSRGEGWQERRWSPQ